MAVIEIPIIYLKKKTSLNELEIIETLNKMGFPTEVEEENFYIEITPNRPDLLGWKGIERAIINYKEKKEPKIYSIENPCGEFTLEKVETRPFINLCVIKGVKEKEYLLESLIDLQEKLHSTIGRNRKKVAIGVHDFDKIELPITYKEVNEEKFIPLEKEEKMSVGEILEKHEKGIEYKHLVKPRKYPMLYDKKGVISFPPIINSERTKITEKTENFLIDVTGTHKESVEKIANIIITELIDRGGKAYPLIEKSTGNLSLNYKYEKLKFEKEKIEKLLGFEIKNTSKLLRKMGLFLEKGEVLIPPYRVDFFDFTDIAEDLAIAYGYENIKEGELNLYQEGELNEEIEIIKSIFSNMGFYEAYNFYLISRKDIEKIGFKEKLKIEKAVSEEHNSIRPSLVFGLIKNIQENKKERLPLKFFEIGKVLEKEERTKIGFVIANKEVNLKEGFEVLKRISEEMGWEIVSVTFLAKDKRKEKEEYLKIFIEGRAYKIVFKINNSEKNKEKEVSAVVGEIHPKVNEYFKVYLPMVFCEITLPLEFRYW